MEQNLLTAMTGRRAQADRRKTGDGGPRRRSGRANPRLDALAGMVQAIQDQLAGLGAAPDKRPDTAIGPAAGADDGPAGENPGDVKSGMPGGGARGGDGGRIPPHPNDYAIEPPHPMIQPDPEVNRALHGAGLSDTQAQLVYDLAAARMLPAIQDMAREFEADRQVERLVEEFGGEQRWREVAEQLAAWGRAQLPREVFEALSTTFEGVMTMHKMMASGEPGMTAGSGQAPSGESEDELRSLTGVIGSGCQ